MLSVVRVSVTVREGVCFQKSFKFSSALFVIPSSEFEIESVPLRTASVICMSRFFPLLYSLFYSVTLPRHSALSHCLVTLPRHTASSFLPTMKRCDLHVIKFCSYRCLSHKVFTTTKDMQSYPYLIYSLSLSIPCPYLFPICPYPIYSLSVLIPPIPCLSLSHQLPVCRKGCSRL